MGRKDPVNLYYSLSLNLGPIVEELAEEGYAVGKLDVDQNMELAQQFRVMSIPTLIIFKNGAEAHRLVGLTDKEDLKKLLDE